MSYKPDYDTTVRTRTKVEHLPTMHREGIDWSYPFDDPEHTNCMCRNEAGKREHIEKLKGYLRECEAGGERFVSNYGGWPRIWLRVLWVGMASCWPHWRPRPTVIVRSEVCGCEWVDWLDLTGFRREAAAAPAARDSE